MRSIKLMLLGFGIMFLDFNEKEMIFYLGFVVILLGFFWDEIKEYITQLK